MEGSHSKIPFRSFDKEEVCASKLSKSSDTLSKHRFIFSQPKHEGNSENRNSSSYRKLNSSEDNVLNQSRLIFCGTNNSDSEKESRLWYIDAPKTGENTSSLSNINDMIGISVHNKIKPGKSVNKGLQHSRIEPKTEIVHPRSSNIDAMYSTPVLKKLSTSLTPIIPPSLSVLDSSLSSTSSLMNSTSSFLVTSSIGQAKEVSLSGSLPERNLTDVGVVAIRPHYQPLNPIPSINSDQDMSSTSPITNIRSQFLSMKNELIGMSGTHSGVMVRQNSVPTNIPDTLSHSMTSRKISANMSSNVSLPSRSDTFMSNHTNGSKDISFAELASAKSVLHNNSLRGKRAANNINGDPSSLGHIASMAAAFAGTEVNEYLL